METVNYSVLVSLLQLGGKSGHTCFSWVLSQRDREQLNSLVYAELMSVK